MNVSCNMQHMSQFILLTPLNYLSPASFYSFLSLSFPIILFVPYVP